MSLFIYAAAWDVGYDRMSDCRCNEEMPVYVPHALRLHGKDDPVESKVEIGAARNGVAGSSGGVERTGLEPNALDTIMVDRLGPAAIGAVALGNSVCCLAQTDYCRNLLRHPTKISSALEMDNRC